MKHMVELSSLETATRSELAHYQGERLRALLIDAYRNNPFYTCKFDRARVEIVEPGKGSYEL